MKVTLEAREVEPIRRLTDDEFEFCFSRVNCLCLDFAITNDEGVLFAKREIEPFKGFWTLPGGIWRYKEPFDKAFHRLIDGELGIRCDERRLIGFIHHINDGEYRSSVSLVFLIKDYEGQIKGSFQGKEFSYLTDFNRTDIQPYHAEFFRRNWPFNTISAI
jgi:ADP-ribose pyrophosphatase YjhB (NUDIX family)